MKYKNKEELDPSKVFTIIKYLFGLFLLNNDATIMRRLR